MYIHPAVPYLRTGSNGNTLVEANPTRYISGLFEFFFETGRVLMDLTLSKTLQHYPKIDYIAAHVGGAFPSILDRMLKSLDDYSFELASKAIYGSRYVCSLSLLIIRSSSVFVDYHQNLVGQRGPCLSSSGGGS